MKFYELFGMDKDDDELFGMDEDDDEIVGGAGKLESDFNIDGIKLKNPLRTTQLKYVLRTT